MSLLADLCTAALSYAARGWRVFPLWPGSKVPAFHAVEQCPGTGPCVGRHAGWERRATLDPGQITAWWSRRAFGIGIACGPSGLLVVDLDVKPGQPSGIAAWHDLASVHGPVPDTYTVTTTSGGRHHYYRHPPGVQLRNTAKKLAPGIDTRAHGGLVVAAGTRIGARAYTLTTDCPVADPPGWLVELLTPPPPPPSRPVAVAVRTGRGSAWLDAAIERQLAYLKSAPDGQRNNALYVSAVALGQLVAGGALTEHEVIDLLTRACLGAKMQPKPSTIASGLRAGRARPRSVAA